MQCAAFAVTSDQARLPGPGDSHAYRSCETCKKAHRRTATAGVRYVGSSRIKRIRRLAEKSARKLIDWLYEMSGIPAAGSPEDLVLAENLLLENLQQFREMRPPYRLAINDVAGIKVVLEQDEAGELADRLQAKQELNARIISMHCVKLCCW